MNDGKCPKCDRASSDWTLCNRCVGHMSNDLEAIPDLLRELAITYTRQDQAGTGNGGAGAEKGLPFDGRASSVRSEVVNTLGTWIRDLDHGDTTDLEHTPEAWCRWLGQRINRIRGHQACDEIAKDIQRCARSIRSVIDQPAARLWCGHCPICETDLYARPGQDVVTCNRCAEILPPGHVLPEYGVAETREPMISELWDSLATAHELVDAVPRAFNVKIRDKDVERWIKHGRLVEQGRRGRWATYHIGTTVTLAREQAATRRERPVA